MTRNEWIGWLLFTASACAFVVSGIQSGDVATLVGSSLFLIACLVFMVPRVRARSGDD